MSRADLDSDINLSAAVQRADRALTNYGVDGMTNRNEDRIVKRLGTISTWIGIVVGLGHAM